ncbi:MAG: NYN domain-containing protein [Anaerolineales bacterium]|nr:NYN domain-containing protein [Anaerolineales bacterium]
MPYLVDGHNLIGAMPGHRLADPDDEAMMITRLRGFCAASGKAVTVYFDRGAPGLPDPPQAGRLLVRFVPGSSSADRAIRAHLQRLRGEARNWTVVSADREVMAAARQAGAQALSSADFLRRLGQASLPTAGAEKPESPLSEMENAQLLREFEAARRRKAARRA